MGASELVPTLRGAPIGFCWRLFLRVAGSVVGPRQTLWEGVAVVGRFSLSLAGRRFAFVRLLGKEGPEAATGLFPTGASHCFHSLWRRDCVAPHSHTDVRS